VLELEVLVGLLICAIVAAGLLLREKIRADRRLRNAIATLPAGIAFYDKSDRLYLWNKPYEDISGSCLKILRRGIQFREMLKEDLRGGHYAEASGREEAWLDERMAMRARGEGSRIQDLNNGRWLQVQDRRTPDGGTVSICVDASGVRAARTASCASPFPISTSCRATEKSASSAPSSTSQIACWPSTNCAATPTSSPRH
jgi:PAS domain-containing protein